MSGPKDYVAEPEFTSAAFSGKLADVHRAQSKLRILLNAIEAIQIKDGVLNFELDGKEELSSFKRNALDVLEPYTIDVSGTFGADKYNEIDAELKALLDSIETMNNQSQGIYHNLQNRVEDYKAYKTYLIYYENSKKAFEDYKASILEKYQTQLYLEKAKEIPRFAQLKLGAINFTMDKKRFAKDFRLNKNSIEQDLKSYTQELEKELAQKRMEINQEVLIILNHLQISETIKEEVPLFEEDLNPIQKKIERLIESCHEPILRSQFLREYQELKNTKSQQEIYFYNYLHDKVYLKIKEYHIIKELEQIAKEVNILKVDAKFKTKKAELLKSILELINGLAKLENHSITTYRQAFEELNLANKTFIASELKRKNELLFLKTQVINSFEKMGYEVMDDLQVIDFEKNSNFYLKIREQKNYINLKFNQDGSFNYFFQIPEEKLSTDEEKLKLAEMQISCDDFKSIMSKLSDLGLKIDLKKSKPVAIENIARIPKSKRDELISKSDRRKPSSTQKRKYLKE